MPVASISMRVLMGMVHALVTPGIFTAVLRSEMRSSIVMGTSCGQRRSRKEATDSGAQSEYQRSMRFLRQRERSCSSMIVVSTIDRGAGSVADSARPIFPKT